MGHELHWVQGSASKVSELIHREVLRLSSQEIKAET